MIEDFEEINLVQENDNILSINLTKNRVENFNLIYYLTFGFYLSLQVFQYNRHTLSEIIITISLIIFTIIINYLKKYLCFKKITFDKGKGLITFKRNFIPEYKVFNYSKVDIISKTIRTDDGITTKNIYLKSFDSKKYLLAIVSEKSSFDIFIKKHMKTKI